MPCWLRRNPGAQAQQGQAWSGLALLGERLQALGDLAPQTLAAFALQGQPGWDLAAVRAALADPRPQTVAVAAPLPVLITYGTALVRAGQVCFFEDVYGLDAALDRALP